MARTQIAVQLLPRGGAALSTTAADTVNGNYFQMPSSEEVLMSFFSTPGGTVTLRTHESIDNLTLPDRVLTLPAAQVYLWVCAGAPYVQDDRSVLFDCSAATSVAIYNPDL